MTTSNPWLSIPLADYEGHMGAVKQLDALSALFARALEVCAPESVAVLGIAGGNGLESLDATLEKRAFRFLQEELRPLSTGKTLWFGVFANDRQV